MYERILVGFDGSSTAARGLVEALGLAGPGVAICVVYVIEHVVPYLLGPDEIAVLEEDWDQTALSVLSEAEAAASEEGVDVETVALRIDARGSIGQAITDEARRWEADLIVIGTHGRGAIRQILLGSVAQRVVQTTSVPVLLIRPEKH